MLQAKDGEFYFHDESFQILSGAIHYFRTVPEHWEDRLQKLKALGLNTVETYIPWNVHEPKKKVNSISQEYQMSNNSFHWPINWDCMSLSDRLHTFVRNGKWEDCHPGC